MRMRAFRPHVATLDRPGEHWRPGVHWGPIAGPNTTIRVFLNKEIRDYAVPLASLANAGIGSPVVVRFASEAFTPIVDLQAGHWGGDGGPGTDEAGAVARGQFYIAVIPRRITGESEEYAWTAR